MNVKKKNIKFSLIKIENGSESFNKYLYHSKEQVKV